LKRALVIFRKELKDTVRDRRTLVVMVLVPILLMPLILVGSVKLQEMSTRSQAEDVVQLMVGGGENAPGLVAVLADNDIIEVIESPGDAVEMLSDGSIDAQLVIPGDFTESIESEQMVLLDLEINSTHANSAASVDKVKLALDDYSEKLVELRLADLEVSADVLNGVEAEPKDTATQKEKGGTFLGYLLPMFLVIFAMIGGMYTAMDISAGEKERKTLEALLMTPASRSEIVTGKFLTVATVSVVTIVLSMAAIFFTAPLISGSMGEVDLTLDAQAALVMVPVAVLLASMFAALLLAVSIFARSYKEAQNYVTPLYLLAVLPVIVANALPSGSNPLLYAIPGFNAVLLFREVLLGEYVASHIIITVVTSIFYTVLSVRYATRIYSREDVLVDEGGVPRRGSRRMRRGD
jgi:sodium transport system permease protein